MEAMTHASFENGSSSSLPGSVESKVTNPVRPRLSSISGLAQQAVNRRQRTVEREVTCTTLPMPRRSTMIPMTSTAPGLANLETPTNKDSRRRHVSSPHSRHDILPRSSFLSHEDWVRAQGTHLLHTPSSTRSLLQSPPSSQSLVSSASSTRCLLPKSNGSRISLLPQPKNAERRLSAAIYPPSKEDQTPDSRRKDEVKRRMATCTPVEVKTPDFYMATPQKMRHRKSKSPEKSPTKHTAKRDTQSLVFPTIDIALNRSKRQHSVHNIVHHGLMKQITPPVLLAPYVDKIESRRPSIIQPKDSRDNKLSVNPEFFCANRSLSSIHASFESPARPTETIRVESPEESQDGRVSRFKPTAYWSGRFMALNDKFMADADEIAPPSTKGGDRLTATKEELRARRVLDALYARCTTPEARDSFTYFRRCLAACRQRPTLLLAQTNPQLSTMSPSSAASWSDCGDVPVEVFPQSSGEQSLEGSMEITVVMDPRYNDAKSTKTELTIPSMEEKKPLHANTNKTSTEILKPSGLARRARASGAVLPTFKKGTIAHPILSPDMVSIDTILSTLPGEKSKRLSFVERFSRFRKSAGSGTNSSPEGTSSWAKNEMEDSIN